MSEPISKRVVHQYMDVLIDCYRRGNTHISADSVDLSALNSRADFDRVLDYLDSVGYISLFSPADMAPIIMLTDKGVSYLETNRDLVSEQRWTRGLAIASIIISIGALIVSVIALLRQ